jgi:glycosyltransferase involved in cell wall biosynthesis
MIANNPLVSVVVPVYNAEKYITECIESVLCQTIKEWELILVDDCGIDHSMDIVKDFALKDNRIRFIESDNNLGPMIAREKGYTVSKGKYITFLDSDDVLPNKALELLLQKALESETDIVSGNIEYFYSDGTRKKWNNKLSYGGDKVSIYKSILEGEFTHNLCGKLFRGELLRDNEYSYYENFTNGEDAIFFYEIVDNISTAVTVPEVVYEYRQNPASSSQARLNVNQLENIVIADSLNYKKCLKYPELDKYAYRYFSKCLNEYYVNGYNRDGVFDKLVKKYGIEHLATPIGMLKNLPFPIFMKQILKRFLKNK